MDFIPIVDFSKLTNATPSPNDWTITAYEVFHALNGIGFVYLKNHGVDQTTIDTAFEESKRFYELPDDVKEKSIKDIAKSYNGYAKPGQESLLADSAYEFRESYDLCGNLRHYPEAAPAFGPALEALEVASKPLIQKLLHVLAIALEINDKDFFIKHCKNIDDLSSPTFTTFRSLYYPPTWNNKSIQAGTVRCADHSDYGILTLLFQDAIGGLEVKSVNGKWVPADPIPETILVNTGDLLEFWSGGLFPATHHRVLIPEAELKQKSPRQSIVYFVHPDHSVLVQPIKTSRNAEGFKEYDPITAMQHASMRLTKSYNY